jgi:hypothetical protein
MILEDDGFAVAYNGGDASRFLSVQDDSSEIVVHGMALIESKRVLGDHVKWLAKDRESLAGDAVRMAGSVHIRSGFVDLAAG